MEEVESLNNFLHKWTETVVSGIQAAVCKVQSTLNVKRSDKAFQSLFDNL